MTALIPNPLDSVTPTNPVSITSSADIGKIESVPLEQRLRTQNTYDAIKLGAAINPDAPAIQFLANADPDEDPLIIRYRDFVANITRTANMLHHYNVGPNDVVSFLLPLLPQAFYTLFGAEAAGIANPVNPLLEPHQLSEILRAANTQVLITLGPTDNSDIWQKVEKIRHQLPALKTVIQVGGDTQPGTVDFDSGMARFNGVSLDSVREIKGSDTAAFFHTGGTTGTPKLVPHTHLNQVYQAWAVSRTMPAPEGDNLLFGLPLFHVGGALTQGISSLSRGVSLVVLSDAGWRHPCAVRNIWRLVERYQPTVLGAVPTVLAAAESIPVDGADVSSVAYSSGGGSAIPVAVGKALQLKLNSPVTEVYGMTETSSMHTIAYPGREIRLGSAGLPIPYSQVRIVKLDDQGTCNADCDVDEIGVVAMAGPGVFTGYLNDEHNKGAFVEPGWVNSGDLGRLDADGYLWLTGRAKDLIIRGGHNIDPAGVEDILFGHQQVALAAMVGQPDSYAGELPLAFVQLLPNASVGAEVLLAHVREHTPERAAVPVEVILVDEMPLTGVGKVFKPKLRWLAAQRVFESVLCGAGTAGVDIDVSVGSHGTHGSLATVTITGAGADGFETTKNEVEQRLAAFVMAKEIISG